MISPKWYVAHLDMLGFKAATKRNPDGAWAALCRLRERMDKILQLRIEVLAQQRNISDRVRAHIFSDSILLFTLGDDLADLTAILLLSSQLFADGLSYCIPLRGGIACGDFFINEVLNLYCGVPFVTAYELGEQSQWCGIVLDEVVANRFNQQPDGPLTTHDNIPTIIQWDVPVNGGEKKKSWVVNWPMVFRDGFSKASPLSVQEYYKAFESLLGPYDELQASVQDKHQNTVDFINSQLRRLISTK